MSVPFKVKCFVWLVLKNRVTVKNRLQRLGFGTDQGGGECVPLCRDGREDSLHLFLCCNRICKVWDRLVKLWSMN